MAVVTEIREYNQKYESFKIVVLGDGGVGKTTILIVFVTKEYPSPYIPSIFDNYACSILLTAEKANEEKVQEQPENEKRQHKWTKVDQFYNVGLWDTRCGGEDDNRMRPLSYTQTDVFLVCFDITNAKSFENVRNYWKPEIAHYMPKTPWLLIGNKSDLRPAAEEMLSEEKKEKKDNFITKAKAEAEAADLNAVKYLECSSLLQQGVDEVFLEATKIAVTELRRKRRSWRRKCKLL